MKEWGRSKPFVSNSVRVLREEQLRNHLSVAQIFVTTHLLRELPTYPGSSIQHLADPIPLRVAGDEVSVVQQHGHLRNCKFTDSFHPDRHI